MSRWKKESDSESVYVHERQTVGKTENFFTRNIRLFTFLITVGVFLAIFGPLMVLEAKDYFGQENDPRPKMTLQNLVVLSEQENGISLNQITKYACDEQEKEYEIYCYIDIEPHYTVLAVADKNTKKLVYCSLLNGDTGEAIDVLKDDLRAYLAGT